MQLPVLSARRIEITASRSTRSFSRKCRLQVTAKHAHALDPTKSKRADSAIQIQCATHQGNELTGTSSGNACPQSSQPAEPLWTGPWPKRVKLVLGSLSPLKKKKKKRKKKRRLRNDSSNLSLLSSLARKSHYHHHYHHHHHHHHHSVWKHIQLTGRWLASMCWLTGWLIG